MKKISVFGLEVTLEKRINQKTLRLSVLKTGVVKLSIPALCSEKQALLFLKKHQEWVKTHQKTNQQKVFQSEDEVMILGTLYRILHEAGLKGGPIIKENQLIFGGDKSFLHRRVLNFAKKELLKYVTQKAFFFAEKIDKKINKISLKDTTSRWGSCSSKNNLNFCFKLAFAPLYVIDYLVAHEVAHLKEMNHSDDFWRCVAKMETEQAKAESWLRKNGPELMKIK